MFGADGKANRIGLNSPGGGLLFAELAVRCGCRMDEKTFNIGDVFV